ncbi:MAG: S41 family peptidase [Bacteroidota bacterium]|nr:S41 family peptidase [Bacteroidota bacterium]
MKKFIFLVTILVLSVQGWASNTPLWMRYPKISPDGREIVFSYKGDLYIVAAEGGTARQLTNHPAYDFNPIWSHDGKTIAFASNRYGNFDIFTIPEEGGEATRVTFHSANEIPECFSNDDQRIIFSAHIQDDVKNAQFPSPLLTELYEVPAKGGRVKQIITTPALNVCYSKEGKNFIYEDIKGYEDKWRKHHTSPVTRDIWKYSAETGKHTKLTSFNGEDRNPVYSNDEQSIFYLSEKSGSFNVWKMNASNPDKQEQISFFDRHPVRFLSLATSGKMCYSYNGGIYIQTLGGQPQKINVTILSDQKKNPVDFMQLNSGITEMSVSPNGKEVAFIVRGEVYVTSVEYSTTKRITNTPTQERSVSFSPDGRSLIYAGERNGNWKIYQTKLVRSEDKYFFSALQLKEEPLIDTDKASFQPRYSPDGKEVAFLESRTILKVINLASKHVRTVLDWKYGFSYTDGDQWFDWSPDSKWFLFSYDADGRWVNEVGLIDAQGMQKPINLTQSGYADESPKWMMKGDMMIWFSDRMGLRSHGGFGSEQDVYAMFFNQEAWDKFKLSKEEYELKYGDKPKEKSDDKSKDKSENKDKKSSRKGKDTAAKDSTKTEVKPIKLQLENIEDRVTRLTINSSDLSDAVITPDGKKLYYLSHFEKGYDLWEKNLRENETKLVMKLNGTGGSMQFDKEGKFLFLVSGGTMMKIEVSNNQKTDIGFRADFTLNNPEEKSYIFEHAWKQVKEKFYDPNLHGVDWERYKKDYEKFLPDIDNNFDFAEMLSELLGELNGSHTGCRYSFSSPSGDRTACLGALIDWEYTGDGLAIAEVLEKGPMNNADSRIKAGIIIEKINDQQIKADMDYFSLLNRLEGKNIILALYDPQSKKRWEEVIKPISNQANEELLYQRWVKQRRTEVEYASEGRVGYVHVRGMDSNSFRTAFSDILGRFVSKEAIIVDTRFNGGGWLHDDLATLLMGKRYVDMTPRDKYVGSEPMNKWYKKSCVLMSESNYSDAHAFPWTYKTLGIGPLIGAPVAGTMTAVWWEDQIDPSLVFGIPEMGCKDMNGKYLENQTLLPDYLIYNDYDIVSQGTDQQLQKAVEVMLK